jgi:hypothetical protein
MHRNCIESKHVKPFLPFLIGIRRAGLSPLAAVVLVMATSLSPATAHAQEYPWCLSREGALNPRLLFPNKPRDSDQNVLSHVK